MKTTIATLSLATLFFAACGDSTEQTASTTDTSQSTNMSTPAGPAAAADPIAGMKASMDKMMADLKGMQPSGDPDYDFAALMRTHHEGAVAMMQAYLPGATDATLRGIAEQGVAKQQSEIGELSTFLSSHQPAAQKSDYGKNAVEMVMSMMQMDAMPQGADKAFAAMMIPHHESAVHISQMYQSQGKDAKLKEMAKKIATEQQQEVDALKSWMQAHP